MVMFQGGSVENNFFLITHNINLILKTLLNVISCHTPNHVLSKRYWSFEFICLVLTGVFTSFVVNRKRYLDKKAMERMRAQILS